jgi:hypothetical protein
MILPLAWELMAQKGFAFRKLSPAAMWLLLVPGGLVVYMGYLYFGFGNAFAFAETQVTGWGHGFTNVWTSLHRDLMFLLDQSELWVVYELGATAVLVAGIAIGLRKLRGSYNIYMLVSLLIPLFGGTSKSMSRYLLVVFPLFMLMAMYTKKPAVRYCVYAVSLGLLAVSTVAFTTGRWVA